MTSLLATVAAAAAPWAELYADSAAVQSFVMFVHLGSLLLAGGMAIAADASAVRAPRDDAAGRGAALLQVHAAHRPVLVGLAFALSSGLLLLAADVETYLPSPVLWVKLGLIALLLVNGLAIQRAERAADAEGDAGWARVRGTATRSIALWFGLVLVSVILVNSPGTG